MTYCEFQLKHWVMVKPWVIGPLIIIPNNHVHTSYSRRYTYIRSYWLTVPNYHVHISKSFQDVRQNHCTMAYWSLWSTFSLRSYWFIPSYQVHSSNSLRDIRQIHLTIKYIVVHGPILCSVDQRCHFCMWHSILTCTIILPGTIRIFLLVAELCSSQRNEGKYGWGHN